VKSIEQKEITDGKFAIHLGKRIQHVVITNEKDSVKVIPKGWLDKQVWKALQVVSLSVVVSAKDSVLWLFLISVCACSELNPRMAFHSEIFQVRPLPVLCPD
jgi:hypothetical protein